MLVTIAAVPQANTSTTRPLSMPLRTSSMSMRRSLTSRPRSRSSVRMVSRVTPSRMLPGRRGGCAGTARGARGAVVEEEPVVHPAELLQPAPLDRIEEQHLLAAVVDCLLLGDEAGGVVAAGLRRAGAPGRGR